MTRVERFQTPSAFEAVDLCEDKCALDLKDVSKSRKELWLIRAPLGFDGSALDDVTLDLDGDSVEFCSGEGDGKKYEALSVRQLKENEGHSPYLLLPSQDDRMLKPGPSFKGQIVIMESVNTASSSESLAAIQQSEVPKIPEGLRQRYKPFGWEKPWKGENINSSAEPKKSSSSKKRHKAHQESANREEVLDRVTAIEAVGDEESEQELQDRKKTKKAKRKQKEEAEQDSKPVHKDDPEQNDGASPRKKKKKKKSKDK